MKLNETVQVPQDAAPSLARFLFQNLQAIARKCNTTDRENHQLSCSDLTTALSVATNVGYFRIPRPSQIKDIRASLLTASSSGAVTIDINVNGSTILSTKLTIDQGEKTSVTAATPHVVSNPTVSDDDEVTIDIDGAGTNAAGLIVTIVCEV